MNQNEAFFCRVYICCFSIFKIQFLTAAASQNAMRPQAPTNRYDAAGKTGNNGQPDSNNSSDSGYPFRSSNPQTSSSSSQHPLAPPGHPLSQLMSQQQQQQPPSSIMNYGAGGVNTTSSRYPFMNSSPAGGSHPAPPPGVPAPNSDKNWQDGLRALLPNINISFACKLNIDIFNSHFKILCFRTT